MKEIFKKKSLLEVIHSEGPFGDCCSYYEYKLTKPCTVLELCEYIISNDGEWGTITIGLSKGEPRKFIDDNLFQIDYLHGKWVNENREEIEFNLPYYLANKQIRRVTSHGGWSNMDYGIYV